MLSCLFLAYVGQPAIAASITHTSDMICCIDMDVDKESMQCCEMDSSDANTCSMDSCGCSIATPSTSAFTFYSNNDLNFISIYNAVTFSTQSLYVQSPFITIWTPPDIA